MLVSWRYRERDSLVQSFDPSAWFVFYFCFIASTLFFWDVRYLAFFVIVALLTVFNSGITFRESRRTWLFIGAFITFFALLTFLTGRGGVEVYTQEHSLATLRANFRIFGWQPILRITAERTMFALGQLARVFSLASTTILIPYIINPSHYGVAFRRLGLPDKIAYAMDLTMRFIPTFGRDFQLTMDAQKARGYELEKVEGGLIAQVRKLAPIMVPVTIRAIAGSEDIIDAMDLRAFGTGPRTWLIKLKFRKRDYALVVFGVTILVISLGLSLFGFGNFWVPEFLLKLAA
ncbi:MAG: energy-coupling factor transporter transmembrane component T [Anaerolineales bacterium]|jgi:energy-coupling factor transport system permease protein